MAARETQAVKLGSSSPPIATTNELLLLIHRARPRGCAQPGAQGLLQLDLYHVQQDRRRASEAADGLEAGARNGGVLLAHRRMWRKNKKPAPTPTEVCVWG